MMATLPLIADDETQQWLRHATQPFMPSPPHRRHFGPEHVAGGSDGDRSSWPEQSRNELDRAAHAAVAAFTGGLSPTSVALAFMDWMLHMTVAPGKLVQLGTQAALASAD